MYYICIRPILLILFCLSVAKKCNADIPIIAYGGVSADKMTKERLMEFRAAGFDVCITNFADMPTQQFVEKLDIAEACGVKLFALNSDLWDNPQSTIDRIKHHPALFGYFIYDEPQPRQIKTMRNRFQQMYRADSTKAFYMNLIPYYDDNTLRMFDIGNYSDYVKSFVDIGVPQICFDYYPITDDGIRPKWYLNLEIIRREALRTNRPFWAFALSTAHADYPKPTLPMLRLQMFTNLAYGAQALLYYTYWTPQRTKDFFFHDGPIGTDGRKTATYNIVQQMNRELKTIASLFDGAKVTSVHHFGTQAEGVSRLSAAPPNIQSMKVIGRQGAVVSQLEKNGHRYMAIVNKSYKRTLQIDIKALNDIPRHLTKQLKLEPINSPYQVQPGDILLFMIK